jgi:hypothetical protein
MIRIRSKRIDINRIIYRFKSTKNVYSNTINLPNAGDFPLSMKNIYQQEENIKKVCFSSIVVSLIC